MTTQPPRDNLRGGAWLLTDMSVNITALSIVKWLGADYPAVQIVFLRALAGLVLILPLIWVRRASFHAIQDRSLHMLRVALSVVTLSASFYAIARVPLAVFSAVGFTRPVVTMVLAALLLRETIGRRRWMAAGLAMIGAFIAANPSQVSLTSGLVALPIMVFAGCGAVIVTRRLRAAPTTVMMTFYTAGLMICTAPLAALSWVPIAPNHLIPLLMVGALAQCAQLCFLRAHHHGEAGFLSVVSYLSLIFSVSVGYLVFDEVPLPSFWGGSVLVIGATLLVTLDLRALRQRT
ncbi:MAG: DMT family transporter [Rhodobacteraceae bacterium]|nr:DMT family transporter [Paracoccaceae bacterium]